MTNPRLIGYWRSLEQPDWPDPGAFVDPVWDPAERELVARYLERRELVYVAAAGLSHCRFGCGRWCGSTELYDGRYIWPEGLPHYLREHQVGGVSPNRRIC